MITKEYKTNNQGSVEIDLSEEISGNYDISIISNETDQYEEKTVTKQIRVFNGYETRIYIDDLVEETVVGKYYDNTRLVCKVQWYDFENEIWKNKSIYTINVDYNNQTVTLNENSNILDLSKINVNENPYEVILSYNGDNTYLPCEKTISYVQEKNDSEIFVLEEISKYVDEDKSFDVILKTVDGNVLPNQELFFEKQDNVYSTVTDNNGVGKFSMNISNDDLIEEEDTETHILDESIPFNLSYLSNNEEYVINVNYEENLTILSNSFSMVFNGNNVLIDNGFYKKSISFTNTSLKLRITNHNGIFRIFEDMKHLYSDENPNSNDYNFYGDGEITNIQRNLLSDGSLINSAECTLSFNGNNDLNQSEDVTTTLKNLELKIQSDINYYIDNYPYQKILNYMSVLSFENDGYDYGYYVNNIYYDKSEEYVVTNNLDIVVLNRRLNYCTKSRRIQRTIEDVDWIMNDTNNFSLNGIGIEYNEYVAINNQTSVVADLGIMNQSVSILNGDNILDTKTTNNKGLATLNVSSSNVGRKDYVVQYEGIDGFNNATSEIFNINYVQSNLTTLTLTRSSNNIMVDDTVTFIADLGYPNKKIKFFYDGNSLDTVYTEDDGKCEITKLMNEAGDKEVIARFEGDGGLNSSESSLLNTVNKYPSNLNVNTNKSLYYIDEFNNGSTEITINSIQKTSSNNTENLTFNCYNNETRKYKKEQVSKTVTISKIPIHFSGRKINSNTIRITLYDVYENYIPNQIVRWEVNANGVIINVQNIEMNNQGYYDFNITGYSGNIILQNMRLQNNSSLYNNYKYIMPNDRMEFYISG